MRKSKTVPKRGTISSYFLGADIGGTKTHALISDQSGQVVGFGESGPGNHEIVGYDGLARVIGNAADQALAAAHLSWRQIAGAGFGVAGYDWPSERQTTLEAIHSLGLKAPIEAVNDALIGLLAGSREGWGVAVVSGTGCNCHGWDRTRQHVGQAIGAGAMVGEGAGASELVAKAVEAIAHEWTRRGPATRLSPALVQHTGARDLADLIEGLVMDRIALGAGDAPLVFEVAAEGDPVALGLIRWAGHQLGELAKGVIRQLEFERLAFDVVLVGSMYDGSPMLTRTLRRSIHSLAPGARLVRLSVPPVVGAVLLGMEQGGLSPNQAIRNNLAKSYR
jgi:N-acetylglucosamine kinase-like BadF-type ATPase